MPITGRCCRPPGRPSLACDRSRAASGTRPASGCAREFPLEEQISPAPRPPVSLDQTPHVLRSPAVGSWAYLRAARFNSRPGHADQLHLDLWWRGQNVALDPGTYLYNAAPPWDNALAGSDVHNTLTVDGQDQMLRAGRFLYLDWAQAQVVHGEAAQPAEERPLAWSSLTARQDGYRRLGLLHQRTVTATTGGWLVEDALLPRRSGSPASEPHTACLHWLLPDWPWQVRSAETELQLILSVESPLGLIELRLSAQGGPDGSPIPAQIQIVRAGERIYGAGAVKPTWGWSSPTYGQKIPALGVRLAARRLAPFYFTSAWSFLSK